MCVAIIVTAGNAIPSDDILYRCFRTNPDGAGFAWADGEYVHFHKGFMEPEGLLKALKKEVPPEAACLIHFRIGTHGGDGPEFTHPFPVTTVAKDMYMQCGRIKGRVLVHNGIIRGFGKDGVLSDTQDFVLSYAAGKVALKRIGYGRAAVLSPDGSVEIYGEWETSAGIQYSNDSYMPYERRWAVVASKSKNTFVGLRKLKDDNTPIEMADTDLMSVGQLMTKKFPGATGIFVDTAENAYVGLPGYSRPVCIGTMAFSYAGSDRAPLKAKKSYSAPLDDSEPIDRWAALRGANDLVSRSTGIRGDNVGRLAVAALRRPRLDGRGWEW